jgi:enoyl-CoA hydratase/carnithine racemase
MTNYGTIDYSHEESIAIIRLNRPKKLNAMNRAMAAELAEATRQLDGMRALVITGDEKAFSAGADLTDIADESESTAVSWQDMVDQIADLPLPTIAAIEGYCLGGGLELALCCDFRIASETARIGTPEVTRGIIPGGGGATRLPRLIGIPRAKEMMLLGDHYSARTVEGWGLVNQVVPAGMAVDAALSLARRLAERAPLAVREVKNVVNKGMEMPLTEARKYERERAETLFGTEDVREGFRAFAERREPEFKGR